MPKLKNVEKKIKSIEGFDVVFKKNGRDVRGDTEDIPQYKGVNKTKGGMTVEGFRQKLKEQYPGFDFDVLDCDGKAVTGQMILSTVRDGYSAVRSEK